MAFGSPIFLFAFLPLCAALYFLVPGLKWKNVLLAAAGLVFYAFGRLADLPVLLGAAAVNYVFGLLLRRSGRGRRVLLASGVTLDLALLVFYKYWNFFTAALWPGLTLPALPLPAGLSFFTFQGISYLADAYREPEQADCRFFPVLQYLCFFPNLISGPLWRYRDFHPMLKNRSTTPENAARGLRRFTVGLGKKLLLAAPIGLAVDAVFALDPSALDLRSAWLGALGYSMQLYLDFSGYSDMAIGLAALFGFRLPENFNLPFRSGSISEFWRRWHITLGGWFRDYLYIPLGGSRKGKVRTVLNKLAVFLATGLWHGASWNFILWGLWHGIFAALETVTPLRKTEKRWFGKLYTQLAVVLGFALFRAGTLGQGFSMIAKLFTGFSFTLETSKVLVSALTRRTLLALCVGFFVSIGFPAGLKLWKKRWFEPVSCILTLGLLFLCAAALASGSFQPFIYAQF